MGENIDDFKKLIYENLPKFKKYWLENNLKRPTLFLLEMDLKNWLEELIVFIDIEDQRSKK